MLFIGFVFSNFVFFFLIALEMKMYSLLENIEDVLFGDRGINFTGKSARYTQYILCCSKGHTHFNWLLQRILL